MQKNSSSKIPVKVVEEIKEEIDKLTYSENSQVNLGIYSRALVWQDEMPDWLSLKLSSLVQENPSYKEYYQIDFRSLVAYRSSLISGNEILELKEYWEYIESLFPGWSLFKRERRSPKLRSLLLEKRNELHEELENWDDFEFSINISKIEFDRFPSPNIAEDIMRLGYAPKASYKFKEEFEGLMWTDEVLPSWEKDFENFSTLESNSDYKKFIAVLVNLLLYRAEKTMGGFQKNTEELWVKMLTKFPNWPLFRLDRYDLKAKKILITETARWEETL